MLKACSLQLYPIVNNKIVFEIRVFLLYSWCSKQVSYNYILGWTIKSFFFCDTHDVQSMFPATISYIPILVKNKQQVHFFRYTLHMLSQSHLFLSYHLRLACYKKRNIIRHYTDNTTVWVQSNSYTKKNMKNWQRKKFH